MQTFKFKENFKRALQVTVMVVIGTVLMLWFNQTSLTRFWEQSYHQQAPWEKLEGYYAWDLGGYLQEGLVDAGQTFWSHLQPHAMEESASQGGGDDNQDSGVNAVAGTGQEEGGVSAETAVNLATAGSQQVTGMASQQAMGGNSGVAGMASQQETPVASATSSTGSQQGSTVSGATNQQGTTENLAVSTTMGKQQETAVSVTGNQQATATNPDVSNVVIPPATSVATPNSPVTAAGSTAPQPTTVLPSPKTDITLKPSDKVFFAGDSLMQGVAPVMQSQLLKQYGIKSINLSKQSTGLAYPSFFNWPKTIKTTLDANPDIRLLIMFLGPNDPWDMPPDKGGRYLKFMSPEWEAQYRQRVQGILAMAKAHHVDVIWIGPPNMRKNKLSVGMHYLSGVYHSEVAQAGEIWLDANAIFKYKGDVYSDYIGDGSNTVKLRSGDGIHFSVTGQKTIANAVLEKIHVRVPTPSAPVEPPKNEEETHEKPTQPPVQTP